MIDISARIHDKYSVEFKSGFCIENEKDKDSFSLNTWIFLPYSLDINRQTYPKSHFYRDVKNYIRLYAPIYSLEEIADKDNLPFQYFAMACGFWEADPGAENMAELEYQIKTYATIVKNALRREAEHLLILDDINELTAAVNRYLLQSDMVIKHYRELKIGIDEADDEGKASNYFAFGDEFLSNRLEQKCYELLDHFAKKEVNCKESINAKLTKVIEKERIYRQKAGHELIGKDKPEKNREVLHRLRLLRKYVENPLFLDADRKEDGRFMRQLALSLGAAIAMIVATIIVFSAQLRYASFTMPLFMALVASYVLKDRVKEIANYYFSTRLSKKYFDTKTDISLKGTNLGWIKESMEFVKEDKVPEEVIKKRDRSDILESDNRNTAEKIILYRKLLDLKSSAFNETMPDHTPGIKDITRFNLSTFTMKMDNPTSEIPILNKNGEIEKTEVAFIYYINFIMQLKHGETVEYKRFRLIMSRNGIEDIETFD
ncbi:hypothetical protein LJC37_02005 [Bacteroidales bacterium OttesenSCG-928-E04]|nr:hypothetical protein [Bacteroidales bacterium OttesenSCG-928-E04]